MSRKKKEDVIREGDTIKVIKNLWVKRVGYKLHFEDILDEVINDPVTREAIKLLGLKNPCRDFYVGLAKARVADQHFGGPERVIIYKEFEPRPAHRSVSLSFINEDHTGELFKVCGKRVVLTGTRRGGVQTGGSFEDPPEWIPAQLEDVQAHVLLRTWVGEIEECHVERVWKAGTEMRHEF